MNQIQQQFFLPSSLIQYIVNQCNLIISHKFIRSCKALRSLQFRAGGKTYLKCLSIEHSQAISNYVFDLGMCVIQRQVYYRNFKFDAKKLKILDVLALSLMDQKELDFFIGKLDLSITHRADLSLKFDVSYQTMDKLLPTSLKKVVLFIPFNAEINLFILVLEKLQNAVDIEIKTSCLPPPITGDTFKELLCIKRKTKLTRCNFGYASSIDPLDLLKFRDIHMDIKKGRFFLIFNGSAPEISDVIEDEMERRKENYIQTASFYLVSSYNLSLA